MCHFQINLRSSKFCYFVILIISPLQSPPLCFTPHPSTHSRAHCCAVRRPLSCLSHMASLDSAASYASCKKLVVATNNDDNPEQQQQQQPQEAPGVYYYALVVAHPQQRSFDIALTDGQQAWRGTGVSCRVWCRVVCKPFAAALDRTNTPHSPTVCPPNTGLRVTRPPGFSEDEAWVRARELLTDIHPAAKPAALAATELQPSGELQVCCAVCFQARACCCQLWLCCARPPTSPANESMLPLIPQLLPSLLSCAP